MWLALIPQVDAGAGLSPRLRPLVEARRAQPTRDFLSDLVHAFANPLVLILVMAATAMLVAATAAHAATGNRLLLHIDRLAILVVAAHMNGAARPGRAGRQGGRPAA